MRPLLSASPASLTFERNTMATLWEQGLESTVKTEDFLGQTDSYIPMSKLQANVLHRILDKENPLHDLLLQTLSAYEQDINCTECAEYRKSAFVRYHDPEKIDVGEYGIVALEKEGAFVQAWIWIPKTALGESDGNI